MSPTPSRRSPIVLALVLVGASSVLAGCGDAGAHLPAGGSSLSYGSSGTGSGVLDSVLGADPGPTAANALGSSGVDDPILAGYDGLDETTGLDETSGIGGDDPWAAAANDWDQGEGSMATAGSSPMLDDGFSNVGYGYGGPVSDYGGYGFGDGVSFSSAGGYGVASYGGVGAMGGIGGFGMDPGLGMNGGIIDDGGVDTGPDPSMDPGIVTGSADPGFAPPAAVIDDGGAVDVGGGVDMGGMDVGGMDVGGGIDAGGFEPAAVF